MRDQATERFERALKGYLGSAVTVEEDDETRPGMTFVRWRLRTGEAGHCDLRELKRRSASDADWRLFCAIQAAGLRGVSVDEMDPGVFDDQAEKYIQRQEKILDASPGVELKTSARKPMPEGLEDQLTIETATAEDVERAEREAAEPDVIEVSTRGRKKGGK